MLLFETNTLVFSGAQASVLIPEYDFGIFDADGAPIAGVNDTASRGRKFNRAMSSSRAHGPVDWEVIDPTGNRILEVSRTGGGLRGTLVEVRLMDGQPVGSVAMARNYVSGTSRLIDASDRQIGAISKPANRAIESYGAQRMHLNDVTDDTGGHVATTFQDLLGRRDITVRFDEGTAVPLRVLTIAYSMAVCLLTL